LVLEMNPEAAERLQILGARPITPERLLRPITRYEAEAQPWQQDEVAALQTLEERMRRALSQSERARAYLAARGITLSLAEAGGLCYLPPAWKDRPEVRPLQKWLDRMIFPLSSPDGRGYAGRALSGWRPGMDENEHKALLDQPGAPERWRKTYRAGWYGLDALAPDLEQVIIVEGPFDRLALMAAGVDAGDIVALVGSRDSRAAEALRLRLYLAGMRVAICIPPDDGTGKDWSERWRRGQFEALAPLFDALDVLAAPKTSTEAPPAQPWRPEWEKLSGREQVYKMAEALGYPAFGEIVPGDWRAWYTLAHRTPADLVAQAYEALLPHFAR
jgi:hypothetical protein